jgi:cystathionine gamma-synthase
MEYRIDTKCIHGKKNENGENSSHPFGSVTVPIFQTATFAHPGIGVSSGYDYSRESNPTRRELEETVSALEGAVDTVACATGMAAIGLVLELFERGDHIICSEDLYGGSVRMFGTLGEERGLQFSYVDTSDAELVKASITPQTKALYIETPSNPTMKVTDFEAMREIADAHGLRIIADNTFLSPYFQNPLKLGADLVLHSGTKFLGGHNDTLAGFLSTNSDTLAAKIRYMYKTVGCCLAPFDSFLILRGIKTLAVRMEKQQENAMQIAAWLKQHPKVQQVYYVGLPEHPGYEVNKKQASGSGSMISFRTDTEQTARTILERVKLIGSAESLGGVESLITYPMLQTHGDVPVEIREKLGITEDFLRFSVGIENVDDLIADLEQAMA